MKRTLLFGVVLCLSCLARAQEMSGTVQVGTRQPLRIVDGWVGSDTSPRFLNLFLVPYKAPRHQLDGQQPYVQLCAWFEKSQEKSGLIMSALTVYGPPKSGDVTAKYSWNDRQQALLMLQHLQVQGKRVYFKSALRDVKPWEKEQGLGSWQLDGSLSLP